MNEKNKISINMKNIIATIALLAILVCLIWTSQLSEKNIQITLLISIILTVSSAIVSWIISSTHSKASLSKENSQLIDRIGEQSSEKILNQNNCIPLNSIWMTNITNLKTKNMTSKQ
jgi:hypothetical protein